MLKTPPPYLYMEHPEEPERRRFSAGRYIAGEWIPESYYATKGEARGRALELTKANPRPRIIHHDLRTW